MTQKPTTGAEDEHSSAPNSPETNEEDVENIQEKNHEVMTPKFSVGQQLDILDSVNYWTEAEVVKYDEENRRIFVSYLFWSSKWDEWVDISPDRVAPLHTHTYNPPNPLKIRQRIEVLRHDEWKEAFVIEESEAQVKVHYRNISYDHDEWIDRSSERIRRFGPFRLAKMKKWKVPSVPNSSTTSVSLDSKQHMRQITQLSDRYNNYIHGLERYKLMVHPVAGDGNCLFRSVAHQIYGDDSFHMLVREKCMDYMEVNAAFFSQFVVGGLETFHLYLHAKRTSGCWGDDPEIQAMCEIYDRAAQIWAFDTSLGARCLRTFHEVSSRPNTARSRPSSGSNNAWYRVNSTSSQKQPIRLSYYGGGHYDSIISTGVQVPSSRAPGEIEDRAINRAKERVQLALTGQQRFEEVKQSSDVDETERAELELALEVSRNHLSKWEDDLDACLLLSTQEISKSDLANEYKDSDFAPQVIETQQQIMQSAIEQSEREYLEKAIEESIKSSINQEDDIFVTEATLLDSAYQASLSPRDATPYQEEPNPTDVRPGKTNNSIDAEMKLALELSQLNEDEILQRVLQESLNHSSNDLSTRPPPTSHLTASLREEEEMQEAIRMSMMGHYGPVSSSTSQNNSLFDDNVDPELELAIQESYRYQRK